MSTLSYLKQAIHTPIALRTKIFEQYGDIAAKTTHGTTIFYFAHPLYAQFILEEHQDNYLYRNPLLAKAFSPFIGKNGIFITNDLAQWYKDRLIAKMSFEAKVYYNDYSKTIGNLCNQMLAEWEEKVADTALMNVEEELDKLIIGIVIDTLFQHFDLVNVEEFAKFVPKIVDLIKRKMQFIIKPLWCFTAAGRKYEEGINYFRNTAKELVRQRLKGKKEWDDLLGHFIHEYRYLNEENIIETLANHVATFLAVGYFTTASLVHWILVMLSLYPHVEREVYAESIRVLGSRDPEYKDLSSLPYLSAVIKETLRLHPSSHTIMRQALNDDEINGYFIPKDTGIILSVSHVHRHNDFWDNPDGFDPLRFIDNPLGQTNRFAYIPFGLGKRNCIASTFSNLEAMMAVSMIVRRFRISLPPHTDVQPFTTTLVSNRPNVRYMWVKKR